MDRIMRDTAAARALREQADRLRGEIQAELGARQDALRAEEQELVALRVSLPRDAFAARAAEFEAKVRALKRDSTERGALLQRALSEATEKLKQRFRPLLIEIMTARGAAIMIDEKDVVLSARALDVTEDAIRRLDEAAPFVEVVLPTTPDE